MTAVTMAICGAKCFRLICFKSTNSIDNGSVGYDYRKRVLEAGGSFDGRDLLVSFLGREPNPTAFLNSLK